MKREKMINWGISRDLQADIRYEPNACKGYVMDLTLGCPHQCTYCLFSPLELKVYKLQNPEYKDNVLHLKLDNFLKRKVFPTSVYLSYSSDPLGDEISKESTKIVLKKLFEHNVNILFITKGVFDQSILDLIKLRPELMNIQIDLSSCDEERNHIVEPGAPSYKQRLQNIKKLSEIKGLNPVVVRMDPLIPEVDDSEKNIRGVLQDISKLGVKEIIVGYMILTKRHVKAWEKNEFLSKGAKIMTEITPTISKQELYSIPFESKIERIKDIKQIADQFGISLSVCGCKDERFKKTNFEWICHPFNRARREELNKIAPEEMKVEYDHLV